MRGLRKCMGKWKIWLLDNSLSCWNLSLGFEEKLFTRYVKSQVYNLIMFKSSLEVSLAPRCLVFLYNYYASYYLCRFLIWRILYCREEVYKERASYIALESHNKVFLIFVWRHFFFSILKVKWPWNTDVIFEIPDPRRAMKYNVKNVFFFAFYFGLKVVMD